MKRLLDLLTVCRENGIRFTIDQHSGQLKMRGNVQVLGDEEINLIRSHKEEIVAMYKQAGFQPAAIVAAEIQPHYELSPAQKRIWILHGLAGGGAAYHIVAANLLEGELNLASLQLAFDRVIERHEILRTVFKENEPGDIRQYILDAREINFSINCVVVEESHAIDTLLLQAKQQPFDLESGPLLRAHLFKLANNRWLFQLVIHHIICDGWSIDILIHELMQTYTSLCAGENKQPSSLRIQYKDYAHWQNKQLADQQYRMHQDYWLKQFEGELPVLEFPGDKARPAMKTYNGGEVSAVIEPGMALALKSLSRQQECTLFMALLTLVQALLHRYTSGKEIIIGIPASGRDQAGLEDQIGLYMNTVALRTRCNGSDNFLQWLSAIKQLTMTAQVHQGYPFDLLVNELHLQQDLSRNPLFDVMVTLKEEDQEGVHNAVLPGNLKLKPYKMAGSDLSKFDWSFNFIDNRDTITIRIVYNSDIYYPATADRLATHLLQMLEAILAQPGIPVKELDFLSHDEKQKLLVTFNNTTAVFPAGRTVVDLFKEQVQRSPGIPALVFDTTTVTYKELDQRSDQLALYLLKKYSAAPDKLIAVMIDRSVEMIVAILAILKAGAAYVPVDPAYPAARIEYILQDCKTDVILTNSNYESLLTNYTGFIILLDKEYDLPDDGKDPLTVSIQPANLAYVIYTSGSTGHPKGVMIDHTALVDYFFGLLQKTNIAECRHFGLVSTIAADLGNTVIYGSLLTGGTLHIFSATDVMEGERIFSSQLDCIKIVPSHWKSLQGPGRLFLPNKCLIFGGESLTVDVLDSIREADNRCCVYNHYGPTETTIGKLITGIDLDHLPVPIPLGAPFCQSAIYILDESNHLLPAGAVGEICISGAGLARGYYNRPDLTAEKFVTDPFREGARLYKTGDLGRWLPDGMIAFAGRKDDQVKIRGYRIEPAEVTAAIRTHSGVETAVVTVNTNSSGEKELVAYVVVNTGFVPAELQDWLRERLPAYMMPAYYIQLDKLPLTRNGKIDKRLLPDPGAMLTAASTAYVPPRNDTEQQLVTIWQELLGRDKLIGIKDNFFEAGGHSLKMMQLMSRINRSFAVRINIQSLFKEPTIESISEQVLFILDQNERKVNRKNLKQVEV
jgi:amino acid adenylation domain-containing protein